MPFAKLKLEPGVDIERTPTLNQTKLASSNLIRFYDGLVQKMYGWVALNQTPFVGTCRGLWAWNGITGNSYLGVGTEQRLQVFYAGQLYDITPLLGTTNPAVSFSTVINTPAVTITDASHLPAVGDWIILLTHVSVGGLVLFGLYQVTAEVDAAHYQITAAQNATSTVTNGGAVATYTSANGQSTITVTLANHGLSTGDVYLAGVSVSIASLTVFGVYNVTSITSSSQFVITLGSNANATTTVSENSGNARIEYLLPTGLTVDTPVSGYGIGSYGAGPYGGAGSSNAITPLRQWSLDNWGSYLIASPTNLGIYYWNPVGGTPSSFFNLGTPAVVVPNSPLYSTRVCVMPQAQIIASFGAEIGGTQQPSLIRWCDAGDFTDWTASTTNQAGSFLIPTGSKIVGILEIGLGLLVWTDVDVWQMSYQGLPFVFAINRLATGCGLVSARAAAAVGTRIIWLSDRGFFALTQGGGITPFECTVVDFMINNLDQTQLNQIHAAPNAIFNEVAWFFPISPSSPIYNASSPLGYLKFNYVENCWDYGVSSQYQRTAWVGRSALGNPIGSDYQGLLQQHEVGYDANGQGMQWSWQTGFFDIREGEDYIFLDQIIPDFATIGNPAINLTVLVTTFPGVTPTEYGPFLITPTTEFVPLRVRGRQIALRAQGNDTGTFNRLGAIRYRFASDGRN